jgi:CheY-like chemotaxis protein
LPARAPALRRVAGRLTFEIADTGIGIAAEDLERIFEPFVQLNPGRGAGEGAGIGSTLSRGLAVLLEGEITVRSQVGAGTCFTLRVPVELPGVPDDAVKRMPPRVVALTPGQPRYRVLVVDDSSDSRSVLRQLLEQVGFTALEAANGQEALEVCAGQRPDLILMDLRMPMMDGYEAVRRVRNGECGMGNAAGRTDKTPVIAVTAHVMADGGPSVLTSGFDDVIYKPVNAPELFYKIGRHLGVQYAYRSPDALDGHVDERHPALAPDDLAVLPVEWLREFSWALRRGRSAHLLALVDRLPPEGAAAGRALAGLVRVHAFDTLMAVTDGALQRMVREDDSRIPRE